MRCKDALRIVYGGLTFFTAMHALLISVARNYLLFWLLLIKRRDMLCWNGGITVMLYLRSDVIIFDLRYHQQQYSNANAACLLEK